MCIYIRIFIRMYIRAYIFVCVCAYTILHTHKFVQNIASLAQKEDQLLNIFIVAVYYHFFKKLENIIETSMSVFARFAINLKSG